MKKLFLPLISIGFRVLLHANPVTPAVAKTAAINFYTQNLPTGVASATLAYSEKDANGDAVYYVFNINPAPNPLKGANGDGFVIISADDAIKPIIGYSNTGSYVVPVAGTNFDFWMQKRKTEIATAVMNKAIATAETADDWTSYINNTIPKSVRKSQHRSRPGSIFPSNTAYLVKSTWDQSPDPYNTNCPGGSVTGCVATTMAQIMRYWNYPLAGTGNNCDPISNYGTICANFAHSYNWANMTLVNPASTDTDIARLMSDAGISVYMAYSPTGSGAQVLTADAQQSGYPYSAQYSYVNYFGYYSNTLDGIYAANYTNGAWLDTIKHDLDENRPVEYAGYDANGSGGHTWVCDGYDANNNLHMNWGWSAYDDGWFADNNLAPAGTGYDFSQNDEALVGIMPPPAQQVASGCDTITNLPSNAYLTIYGTGDGYVTGCYGDTIREIADYFSTPPASGFQVNSVYIYFAIASTKTAGRTVNINIWDNTGTGGAPGKILSTKAVTVRSLSTSSPTLITLTKPITITTPYYVGVDFTAVAAAYKTDTIVVASDTDFQAAATAWQYDVAANYGLNGWYADSYVWNGLSISHAIWVDMCTVNTDAENFTDGNDNVVLYPNPTKGQFTIQSSAVGTQNFVSVHVYNVMGQEVYSESNIYPPGRTTFNIDLSSQPNGMYFVKLNSDKMSITKKVMVSK